MRVLIACEFSGIVREAFRKCGNDAWSCDILPAEDNSRFHRQCDVLSILNEKWDLMIAHPPCTYITNAGVRHLHDNVKSKNGKQAKISGKVRWKAMEDACDFFNTLANAPIAKICIENPIPHKYAKALIGNYTQLIQPWMFGHKESKATCLWLKGLPKLLPTAVVGPPPRKMSKQDKAKWHRVHYASPGKDRWKERSRTYSGIAEAMAKQWG